MQYSVRFLIASEPTEIDGKHQWNFQAPTTGLAGRIVARVWLARVTTKCRLLDVKRVVV
jgi:hypothetical protein